MHSEKLSEFIAIHQGKVYSKDDLVSFGKELDLFAEYPELINPEFEDEQCSLFKDIHSFEFKESGIEVEYVYTRSIMYIRTGFVMPKGTFTFAKLPYRVDRDMELCSSTEKDEFPLGLEFVLV